MNIVVVGHVDHGKSTIIGRLLADTGSLPEGKLEQVRETCRRNSRPFEYAFLLDALKDEQAQGITIDSARVFFQTKKRPYIIIDAPGHIEFLKNMISGAARADAALLVIDANEGIQENSRRHGYMLSMLGIRQIAVLVNKMDLVDYDRIRYNTIMQDYSEYLQQLGVIPACFIPVSGTNGDNIVTASAAMQWNGAHPTIIDILDTFQSTEHYESLPFRMPVQDVYKFTRHGDDRRIVAGTVMSGSLTVGDEIIFFPSGKKTSVKSFEAFHAEQDRTVTASEAVGFTVNEQIYSSRGQIVAKVGERPPTVTTRFRASIFWLGKKPLGKSKDYTIKIGSAKVAARLEEIVSILNADKLEPLTKTSVERHDVAECIFKLNRSAAFDTVEENPFTSRFVIVDEYEISGGGIIREGLPDKQAWVRESVLKRNYRWEASIITPESRAERYNQRATLVLITGPKEVDKKNLAKSLEAQLFEKGKYVYFLGIGNVLYGVDADIHGKVGSREEHIRRLAEVANILLDTGLILVVTASDLTLDELQIIRTSVNQERMETIWYGESITTNVLPDAHFHPDEHLPETVARIKSLLQDKGVIYKPF